MSLSLVQLVARLTKDIVETYQLCNPQFKYSEELNPKRYLTTPSIGVLNDGHDNVNSDLILTANYVLINSEQRRFVILTFFFLIKNLIHFISTILFGIFFSFCHISSKGIWNFCLLEGIGDCFIASQYSCSTMLMPAYVSFNLGKIYLNFNYAGRITLGVHTVAINIVFSVSGL